MSVYVKQKSTGLFYAGFNIWVTNKQEALEFDHTLSARQFCEVSGMTDVEVTLSALESRFAALETAKN